MEFHSFGYEAINFYHDNPKKEDLTKWYYFEYFKMMLYQEKVCLKTLVRKEYVYLACIHQTNGDILSIWYFSSIFHSAAWPDSYKVFNTKKNIKIDC